jgi:hypothetical protein
VTDSDESAPERGGDRRGRAPADGPRSVAVAFANDTRPVVASRSVVAFAGLVLAASVVPTPTGASAGGGSGFPTAVFPAWFGLTGPFHLVGYAVLAALASRAAVRAGRAPAPTAALAVGAATGFGFGIELVQAPIPWRSFAWTDAAVNAVGAAGGAAVAAVLALRLWDRGDDREQR